jgi:hypothetical protein
MGLNAQELALLDLLTRKLAASQDVTDDKVATQPSKAHKKGAKRKLFNSDVTVKPESEPKAKREAGTNIRGVKTGRAPHANGQPSALHAERVAALESLVPGISKIATIFSVGMTHDKKKVEADLVAPSNFRLMVRKPWTWVEFPNKDVKIGKLTGTALFDKMAEAGYSWSRSNSMWVTKSSGYPATRKTRSERAGRTAFGNLNGQYEAAD